MLRKEGVCHVSSISGAWLPILLDEMTQLLLSEHATATPSRELAAAKVQKAAGVGARVKGPVCCRR